jgi:serine protease Do
VNDKKLIFGATVISVGAALSSVWMAVKREVQPLPTPVLSSVLATSIPAPAANGLPDYVALAQQCNPAVVYIEATQAAKESGKRGAADGSQIDRSDPLFRTFMRLYGSQLGLPDGDSARDQPLGSFGSGFIVSADGYVLTNTHVVKGADKVVVKLADRREFSAKVVGQDRQADVAVLKIDADHLPTVKIGDSSKSRVGEWVMAIGSPFQFENTVTSGIISARSRLNSESLYTSYIQSEVPVNPGNSGGPLFNMKGEVIGINSWIFTRSGCYQGLSFSIPINMAMKIKDAIVKDGHSSHVDFGVDVQPVDQNMAKAFGMEKARGVLVSSVAAGNQGEKAGMKPGDVILAVAGRPVDQEADVPDVIADLKPGMTVDVSIWREHAMRTLKVTVAAMPDTEDAADNTSADNEAALPTKSIERLGVVVRELDADEKKARSLANGLLVEEVSGAAQNAGVRAGQVLLAVNGQPVSTADALLRKMSTARGTIALLVRNDDDQQYLAVDLGN